MEAEIKQFDKRFDYNDYKLCTDSSEVIDLCYIFHHKHRIYFNPAKVESKLGGHVLLSQAWMQSSDCRKINLTTLNLRILIQTIIYNNLDEVKSLHYYCNPPWHERMIHQKYESTSTPKIPLLDFNSANIASYIDQLPSRLHSYKMIPSSTPSHWVKDQFTISTSQAMLQSDIINNAFDSDYMYWTKGMPEEDMRSLLANSLCFGVYVTSESSPEPTIQPKQIGFGRLVTDRISMAYLTDVFIIPEYQGHGLGKWLMQCINGMLDSWPHLRSAMLFAGGKQAQEFYKKMLGMRVFVPGTNGLELMEKRGRGDVFAH